MQQNPIEISKRDDIEQLLKGAQIKTWQAVDAIVSKIKPGMTEQQAARMAQETLVALGSRKFWHKCHIRFGQSTSRSFDDPYDNVTLGENDIFYVDIGPIWDGIEGDAGATFVVGTSRDMERCRDDAKIIFDQVADHWRKTSATGQDLYAYAEHLAKEHGWLLAPSYVKGHRLDEFPHSFHTKEKLGSLTFHPAKCRWVLEIQIWDPAMQFGAFYEDILS